MLGTIWIELMLAASFRWILSIVPHCCGLLHSNSNVNYWNENGMFRRIIEWTWYFRQIFHYESHFCSSLIIAVDRYWFTIQLESIFNVRFIWISLLSLVEIALNKQQILLFVAEVCIRSYILFIRIFLSNSIVKKNTLTPNW